ncbi:AAA family ATPase [Myxococcota bacterium]|nr:AAA family ATPase [Myxococcota bacterium]MBU1382297.1 AAA family ATPase [Myxococcota bacterium]MBU1496351.1 AAA family ATPase [Myxococcota bacterium]
MISFISAKGGTGKTTSSLNFAVSMAEKGKKTIIIDTDPMGCIGFSLAQNDRQWQGLVERLIKKTPLKEVIVKTKLENLSILPRGRMSSSDVSAYERLLFSSDGLEEVLTELEKDYECIIIDTPSGMGMITTSVLAVSNFAVLVLQAEPLSLRTAAQTLSVVENTVKNRNNNLILLGILVTMVDTQNPVSKSVFSTISNSLPGIFETWIPRSTAFIEASEKGVPVSFLTGRRTTEMMRFSFLAEEIESRISDITGETGGQDEFPQRTLL